MILGNLEMHAFTIPNFLDWDWITDLPKNGVAAFQGPLPQSLTTSKHFTKLFSLVLV